MAGKEQDTVLWRFRRASERAEPTEPMAHIPTEPAVRILPKPMTSAEDTPIGVSGPSFSANTTVDAGLPAALRAHRARQLRLWPFVVMTAIGVIAIGGIIGERYLATTSKITEVPWVPAVATAPKAEPVHGIGAVAAKREQTLAFKVPGALHTMAVDEGASVKAGQLLATIDSPDARGNRLVAPFDGVVTHRYVSATDLVGSGTPVIAVASPAAGWMVHLALADHDAARARMGDTAIVRFSEYGDTPFTGTVTAVASKPSTSGAFDIEIDMLPSKATLLSGMVARVDIEGR